MRRNIIISGEDIEAWREDEKQTQFLEEQRRKADNHLGWQIQILDKGWQPFSPIVSDKKDALIQFMWLQAYWPDLEMRLYEVVKEKK